MTRFGRTAFVLIASPTLGIILLHALLVMLHPDQGIVKANNLALKPAAANSEQQTVVILVDDFEPQPRQGESFWPLNRLGGDRGAIGDQAPPMNTKVYWGKGVVTATITTGNEVGVWTALNHPIRDCNPLNFSSIFPSQIMTQYQGSIGSLTNDLQIYILDGQGTFHVELQRGEGTFCPPQVVTWPGENVILSGGPRVLSFDLPSDLGEIGNLNWSVKGSVGSFVVVDRVELMATVPTTDTSNRAFLESYAMLLANWDMNSGLTRDHAYYAANEFDNISASGMQAAAAVMAWHQGFISKTSAIEIVTKTTEALLELPSCHGLWPHFTEKVISDTEVIANAEIISGTEWSSIDTTIAAVALIEAREALGLDEKGTKEIEQILTGIYTPTLTQTLILTDGSISHGYTTKTESCAQLRVSGQITGFCGCSQRIEGGWKDFGTESWLVNFGYAAATGKTAIFDHTPPTYNGSGFIDELAWLLLPTPYQDQWGTQWREYSQRAADCQLAYYQNQLAPGCLYNRYHPFYETSGLFGLSAAEVPDLSAVPISQPYQPFGVGGEIPPNDGTELLGYAVIVPHYAGMIASIRPSLTITLWQWIETEELFTPLNNVESFGCPDMSSPTCDQVVWNALKGSWNLSLQTLGWGRLLAGSDNPLYQGMWANKLLRQGYPEVLNYLYTISGTKTVSGQHNREPNSDPARWTNWIYSVTGKYPGLWGGDFLYLPDDVQHRGTMIEEAKNQWNNGSLVTLMWHVCPPTINQTFCDWETGIMSDLTDNQWAELVTYSTITTTLNYKWRERLNEIVPYLEDLQKNGVEVLWRPLHEMNDDWCWWCGRPGPNGSRKLYQITHDYMTNEKGLTNLIWVWSFKDVTTTVTTTLAYYPGDSYVDVVALDPWNDWSFPLENYTMTLAIANDKPIAIGETAKLPSPTVLAAQPRWTWFLGWAELVKAHNSEEEIKAVYNDCRVVNRGLIKVCAWLPMIIR